VVLVRYENWVAVRFKLCLGERYMLEWDQVLVVSLQSDLVQVGSCKLAGFRLDQAVFL